MAPRRLRPALVLSVWTFLIWTTRIRNIWTDDSLTTGGQVWRTTLAGIFTIFAIGTVVVWRRRAEASAWVRAFAVWTVGVWVVRAVQIGLADHGAAFKVVHTVLAIVSTALAFWAASRVSGESRDVSGTPGSRPARV